VKLNVLLLLSHRATAPIVPEPPHYRSFMIALRYTTFGRAPLDEWSARRRELYLTKQNTHNRYIHASGGIRTHNFKKRKAADSHLRPHGHWHQLTPVVPKLCSAIQRDPRPVPRGPLDIFL